jgi:hypothetical protein
MNVTIFGIEILFMYLENYTNVTHHLKINHTLIFGSNMKRKIKNFIELQIIFLSKFKKSVDKLKNK